MYDNINKPSGQSPLILFATPPPLDQLLAITVRLTNSTQNVARFQPQVIKCREFIFTEPDIIGTPSLDINDHCFFLVAQVCLMNSGRLQTRLARIGLEGTKPYSVTPELYQSCLRYTLLARLSPTWNKAGLWLIQGRDFLTHKGCAHAVRMDLSVSHDELYFTLEAAVLKLIPLQVTDLDILGKQLDVFLKYPDAQIDHDSIASDWCYILPSMKRGRIISISHELPEDSPFRTYRDLKRHWKNTYGYRLPENEDEMNFYQIHFGPLGGKLFTYPEVCIRGREFQRMARVEPKPILRAFMLDIQSKFPTICGCPLKLQSKAKFTVNDLLTGEQAQSQTQPNLTSKMSASRSSVYRSRSEMERLLADQSTASVSQQYQHQAPTPVNHHKILGKTPEGSQSVPRQVIATQPRDKSQTSAEPASSQHLSNISHQATLNLCQAGLKRNMSAPHNLQIVAGQHVKRAGPNDGLTNSTLIQNYVADIKDSLPAQTSLPAASTMLGNRLVNVNETETPLHNNRVTCETNTQGPVARKLFPQFKATKPTVFTEHTNCSDSPSTKKIVPLFHSQKKFGSSVSGVQTTVRNPVSTAPSRSPKTLTPGTGMIPSFTGFLSTPVVHRTVPVFQKPTPTNKTVPSFQKTTPSFSSGMLGSQKAAPNFSKIVSDSQRTSSIGETPKQKKGGSGKTAKKDEKMPKEKKSAKRSKQAKGETKDEKKTIKKMKKAEA